MNNVRRILPVFLILSAVLLVQGCGSSVELTSNWSESPVVIDGKPEGWFSFKKIEDSNVMLGVKNDQDFLYLCLESTDQMFRRQMMGLGMTIWFEMQDGDKLGVHYPLGMGGMGMGPMGGPGRDEGAGTTDDMPEGGPPDIGADGQAEGRGWNMPEIVKELEILGPGKNDVERMSLIQTPGIEIGIGQSRGTMVYELKIPLKKTKKHPYALASNPGSIVAVKFETGKFTRPAGGSKGMSGGMGGEVGGEPGGGVGPGPGGMGPVGGTDGGGPPGGGMPGGGMGGGRGGRGGRGGGMREGGGKSEAKQFKLETRITLAPVPSVGPSSNSSQ